MTDERHRNGASCRPRRSLSHARRLLGWETPATGVQAARGRTSQHDGRTGR